MLDIVLDEARVQKFFKEDIEFVEEGKQVVYVFKGFEQTNNLTITFLKNAFMSKKIRLLKQKEE